MVRPRIDRANIFKMLALGWDKKKVLKEGKISERSYFNILNEFQGLSEEERQKITELAREEFSERIFDKRYWFDKRTKTSQIPELQKWYDVLMLRDIPFKEAKKRITHFRNICLGYWGGTNYTKKRQIINWKIRPSEFSEDHGVQYIVACKKLGFGDHRARLVIRNFLLFGKGIVPTRISGEKQGYGKMAKEYLSEEEIERIYTEIRKLPEEIRIPLESVVKFIHHSGTRAEATCKVLETDFSIHKFNGIEIKQVTVYDKGKWKHPQYDRERKGVRWDKMLLPILERQMRVFMQWRREHAELFNGKNFFGFTANELRGLLKPIYQKVLNREIRQPLHIWRHTFAMHYLRLTGWNYDLVAMLGGWDDTKTLKDCYGKPEIEDVVTFVMQNGLFRPPELSNLPIFDYNNLEVKIR